MAAVHQYHDCKVKHATLSAPSCWLTQNITLSSSSRSKTMLNCSLSLPARLHPYVSCQVAFVKGCWRMERRSAWAEEEACFVKWNEEANKLKELTLLFTPLLSPQLIHLLSLSFPCVQVPQILSPSALIIKTPTPYSLSLAITYTLGTHCPLV